jgi:dimethylamine monooxygenase subunit B
MSGANTLDVTVADVVDVDDLVRRFHFRAEDGGSLPGFSGGSHVVVEMQENGGVRRNPYSLTSSPRDTSQYTISVRRHDDGRGGSLYMHRRVEPGMRMRISRPVNLFALDLRARKHLMIAGGIGITPFLAQTAQLGPAGAFELHYCARSPSRAAYSDELAARFGSRVRLYCGDRGERLDIAGLLRRQPLGTHLYVCGPDRMIDAVREAAQAAGWPPETVHFEHFTAPPPGRPFSATLAVSGITVDVGPEQSLLEAIEAAGVDPPYLCRGGACGQCETRVISHDGRFLHNDHWLSDEERASGGKIMPCVSRFEGRALVLER